MCEAVCPHEHVNTAMDHACRTVLLITLRASQSSTGLEVWDPKPVWALSLLGFTGLFEGGLSVHGLLYDTYVRET